MSRFTRVLYGIFSFIIIVMQCDILDTFCKSSHDNSNKTHHMIVRDQTKTSMSDKKHLFKDSLIKYLINCIFLLSKSDKKQFLS